MQDQNLKRPISVIVTTKNEEGRIAACINALSDFAEVIIVDSNSSDRTQTIAKDLGVRVVDFIWNAAYPKKRQWCLDYLDTQNPWIFFVDADEIVTADLSEALAHIDYSDDSHIAGYFIKGQYVIKGQMLKHGLCNNKLALIHRDKMCFPVINDLDIEGMGEMEGHYQPVLKPDFKNKRIGQIDAPLLHYAYETDEEWLRRHKRYAKWEVAMNARDAWPDDPVGWRALLKRTFRYMPLRGWIAFFHCYIYKCGFMDGRSGFDFALKRKQYYDMIAELS